MTAHPTLADLLERSDDPSIQAHVAGCAICDARRLVLEVQGDSESVPGIDEARRALADVRRLAAHSLSHTWGADPLESLDRPDELAVGRRIERYQVRQRITSGGMGTVYEVEHEQLGSRHALKVLHRTSESVRNRLILEGRAQSRMRHANVVPVTDVVDVDGAPGLIMAFVDGPSLSDWLREHGPPSLDLAYRIGEQVLRAIVAAHDAGIVHRDLKPGNVLIESTDEGPTARVCDFGLALWRAEDGESTAAPGPLGTPGYMAPEQIRDAGSVDARSDLFSLGAVLYELTTGQRAFDAPDHLGVWDRIRRGDYRPAHELRPELPVAMADTIQIALSVDPDDRFASAARMLEQWRQAAPDPPMVTESVPRPAPTRAVHPATLALAALAVVGVGVLGVLALRTTSGNPEQVETAARNEPGTDSRDRRLTAMPAEYQIFSIALSRDDDALLYTDGRGIWVKSVSDGTTRSVLQGGPFHSIDWADDETAFVTGVQKGVKGIWTVDVGSGALEPLTTGEAAFVRASPDGESVAWADDDGVQLMRRDGTGTRRIREVAHGDHISALAWSPSGDALAAVVISKGEEKPWIERFGLDGSEPVRLVQDGRLVAMGLSSLEWVAPDRLLYGFVKGYSEPSTLFAIDDASTAVDDSGAWPVRTWDGYALIRLRSGGSELVASRGTAVMDIWTLDPAAPDSPKLATPEDWDDRPIGWRGGDVVTVSNRGSGGLFALDPDDPMQLDRLPDLKGFRIDAHQIDGALLVSGFARPNKDEEPRFVVHRIEEGTGEVQPLLSQPMKRQSEMRPTQALECASGRCLVSESDGSQVTYRWLNPTDGTLSEPVIEQPHSGRGLTWGLSPDASRVVVLLSDPPERVDIELETGERTVVETPLDIPLSVDWAADGTVYASGLSHSSTRPYRMGRLSSDGQLDVMRSSMNENYHSIYSSPDGSRLALGVYSFGTDVWMLDTSDEAAR